ncbi:MAG: UDP-galactopyranose mutase [Bacteroidetes bacterium]|nr:UDP-galactopyranose mutase [Bacteroidota bacterium]
MELNNVNFLVVGAGFFGSVIAERIAADLDQPVIIIDKRDHIGGNCYSEKDAHTGIEVHRYGTHIFHTSGTKVWDYIRQFTEFNNYHHQVLTTHNNKVYQMPVNLETINSFYNLNLKPYEVRDFLARETALSPPAGLSDFESVAISSLGRPLYEAFIKGYTMKQWNQDPANLPSELFTRLPFRTNYDENYFFSSHQGIPLNGYTAVFENLLSHRNIEVRLNTDFFNIKDSLPEKVKVIYTGPVDELFGYRSGTLEWRSLLFEYEQLPYQDYQGTSVMNYSDINIPYTRIHEFKHLHPEREETYESMNTIICREYSTAGLPESLYYPVRTPKNEYILKQYLEAITNTPNLITGGRQGSYTYLDMDQTIESALDTYETKIKPLWNQ